MHVCAEGRCRQARAEKAEQLLQALGPLCGRYNTYIGFNRPTTVPYISGDLSGVRAIISEHKEGASEVVNFVPNGSSSLLFKASEHGQKEVVKFLIEQVNMIIRAELKSIVSILVWKRYISNRQKSVISKRA